MALSVPAKQGYVGGLKLVACFLVLGACIFSRAVIAGTDMKRA